jgi:hypothetical protein
MVELIGASHLYIINAHLAEDRLLAVTTITHVMRTGNHNHLYHNWEITHFAEFGRLSRTHCTIQLLLIPITTLAMLLF